MIRRALLAFALLATSCVTTTYTGHSFDEAFDRETAPAHIESARAEIESGQTEIALDRLIRLHQTPSIAPVDRKVAGDLLNTTCVTLISELKDAGQASRLKRIFKLEVPPRLRIEAGIAAAQAYLDDEERVKCFRQVRAVEDAFPMHHLRMQAGDLLLQTGLSLATDDSRWFLFFSPARDRALEVLDYLVLHYPFHPGCDLAYQALGELYEAADWDYRAIARYEDLVAYHPNSVLAPVAEARVPLLRLAQMDRSDYDRHEVLRAREEAASWLNRYPDHELAGEVAGLVTEASRRLVENDLDVARFYLRVDEAFGARLHAERAREEAGIQGLEELGLDAVGLLERATALEGQASAKVEDEGEVLDPTNDPMLNEPIPGEVDAG
ncbi:MAG: hypothetical protein P1V81_01330 [Planctomycetota bacterium]|nr:hypothetical protein [Planctomycetota bacterium]